MSELKSITKSIHLKTYRNINSAFTLIELLVVIAIIAILAAILFPVFARARENARRASCQSNLKQIGLGLAQYSQDYDEKLVLVGSTGDPVYIGWQYLIEPYVKSKQVYRCPSNSNTQNSYKSVDSSYANVGDISGNYVLNSSGSGAQQPFIEGQAVSLASIASSSQVIAATEYDQGSNANWQIELQTTSSSRGGLNLFAGHLSTTNYLFLDGHVKSLKPFATVDSSAGGSSAVNLWTRDNSLFSSSDAANVKANLTSVTNKYQ